jgi:hypothetical protein
MTLHQPAGAICARIWVPLPGLLDTAMARLRRQAQYARPLARGGRAAEGLQLWLEQAAACVTALARPEAMVMQLEACPVPGGVRLADRVTLEDAGVAALVERGATVSAYLLTLNYDQARAFEWLGCDYGAHHVQTDLGSEVLFALGRHAHRLQKAQSPAGRLRRIPIQAHGLCGQRRLWDPARVQALLGVFDSVNPGVRVTDSGCFQPLNSLLGLTLHH